MTTKQTQNKPNYTIGQSLHWESSYLSNDRGKGYTVTITKVGRIWLELDNGERVDKNTLIADPGNSYSRGCCHADKSAFDVHIATKAAWSSLVKDISHTMHTMPKGVTLDAIKQARQLLCL